MRPLSMEGEASTIKVDITEDEKAYKVRAEIPGEERRCQSVGRRQSSFDQL